MENGINYILLDIDGVLNTEADWGRPFTLNKKCVEEFAKAFEPYKPKIILASSWRKGFVARNNESNAPYIKQLEKYLEKYDLCVNGVLNYAGLRGKAAYEFSKTHPGTLVVDYYLSELGDFKTKVNLIITNSKKGFKKENLKAFINKSYEKIVP